MTDKPSNDDDFNLNKFDSGEDNNSKEHSDVVETESFYTADPFTDVRQQEEPVQQEEDPFDSSWGADHFAEPEDGKKEPVIMDGSEAEPSTGVEESHPTDEPDMRAESTPPEDAFAEPAIPPVMQPDSLDRSDLNRSDMPSSTQPPEHEEGTKITTVFAIAAMLIAAIAVWLNLGDEDTTEPYSSQTVLGSDVQIQRMERRLSVMEEQATRQNESLRQQVANLEQQVNALTGLIAEQTKKQRPATVAPASAPTPAIKSRPARVRPATTHPIKSHPIKSQPVKAKPSIAAPIHKANTGWAVNIVSVDSEYAANKALAGFKSKGIPAEISRSSIKGKTWYRIRISGFSSKQKAVKQKAYLSRKYGIKDAWVHKP